ncbi:MAG: DsrE family protein, partial [Betaproteobacteria bacterium]
ASRKSVDTPVVSNGADVLSVPCKEIPMIRFAPLSRTAAGLLAALALAAVMTVPAQAQQAPVRSKLVMQVSDADPGKWNLALNNAKNVQADLGAANVDIEIVAYGPGIGMLKAESTVGNRVGEAMATGIKVVACENTLHSLKLTHADMLPKIDYVSAGVVELMQKQQQGWSYIRP